MNPSVQRSGLGGGHTWWGEIVDPSGDVVVVIPPTCNVIPQERMDHIMGMILGVEASLGPWHIGVYENNYVPTSAVGAADLQSLVGECQAYSAATRPLWGATYDGVSVSDNAADPVEFLMTSDKTLYGSFLCTSAVKGSNNGLLGSIVRFQTPQVVPAGFTLRFVAALALIPLV